MLVRSKPESSIAYSGTDHASDATAAIPSLIGGVVAAAGIGPDALAFKWQCDGSGSVWSAKMVTTVTLFRQALSALRLSAKSWAATQRRLAWLPKHKFGR